MESWDIVRHDYSRTKEVIEDFSTAYRCTVCITQSQSLSERTLTADHSSVTIWSIMIVSQPNDQVDIQRIQMVTARPLEA